MEAQEQAGAERNRLATAESEIRAILSAGAAAASRFDVESVMAQYADDIVSFDCPPPLVYQGKEQIRESWQRDVIEMFNPPVSFKHEDVHVVARDDIAFARSIMRFSGSTKQGEPMDATMRCTHCFEKRNGKWLIVHSHISVPIDYDGKGLMNLER